MNSATSLLPCLCSVVAEPSHLSLRRVQAHDSWPDIHLRLWSVSALHEVPSEIPIRALYTAVYIRLRRASAFEFST